MKTVVLKLEITFEDSISDNNEIFEIMKSVARAIEHEAGTMGIAPEDSNNFTNVIRVSSPFHNKSIEVDLRFD